MPINIDETDFAPLEESFEAADATTEASNVILGEVSMLFPDPKSDEGETAL